MDYFIDRVLRKRTRQFKGIFIREELCFDSRLLVCFLGLVDGSTGLVFDRLFRVISMGDVARRIEKVGFFIEVFVVFDCEG